MFDLDAAVDRWLTEAVAAEPHLAPYADEIADHLTSASKTHIAGGTDPAAAFALATEALGRPSVLAGEFKKDGGLVVVLHRLTRSETAPTRREELTMASAYVCMSLFWAGLMIVIEDGMTWVLFAWIFTTYLPMSLIWTRMSTRCQKRSAA